MAKRKIVVLTGDMHAGSDVGLLSPDAQVETIDSKEMKWEPAVRQNSWQEWTWSIWEKARKEVKVLAGKDDIVVIHNGDATQGNKYKESLLYLNMLKQADLAYCNLLPWITMKNVKKLRLIGGTISHEGFEYQGLQALQNRITMNHKNFNSRTIQHGLFTIGEGRGILTDVAHRGPGTGSRSWLEGNVARYYLRDQVFRHKLGGYRAPDLFIRNHFHYPVNEDINEVVPWSKPKKHHLWIVPSMAGMNAYARNATKSATKVWNGVVAMEAIGNDIKNFYFFGDKLDLRIEERL